MTENKPQSKHEDKKGSDDNKPQFKPEELIEVGVVCDGVWFNLILAYLSLDGSTFGRGTEVPTTSAVIV